jgi:hypothetical protein
MICLKNTEYFDNGGFFMLKKILSAILVIILSCLLLTIVLPIIIPVGVVYILGLFINIIIEWGLSDDIC